MRKDILIIISLFFVAFLIRVVNISNVCMYGDEWIYESDAYSIISSNFAPREEVFKYANPFFPYIGAVVTVLFGGELNTLRMVSVIFGSLTVPMLYLFGKTIYNRKTGLLSALFLCFSAFHCLRSRIFMFEALAIFFITAFLYFFWLSQRSEGKKSTTYACIAGAMMGLAIDAKYIALFLIPAVIAYVLWTRKFSLKAMLDKRIILTFVFAFLLFLPLLIGLFMSGVGMYPFYYQAVERFEETSYAKTTVVGGAISELSADRLLVRGIQTISDMLCRGSEVILPWPALFKLSTMLLLIMTLLSYLTAFINRERKGSFLILLFLAFYAFLFIACSRHDYYVIYSLPFYFVMLSHFALKSSEHLGKENNYKTIFGIFIFLLLSIVLFSSVIIGVAAPYWDEGDASWVKSGVDYIKYDLAKSGHDENVVIGIVTLPETIDYYLHFSSDINAYYILITVTTSKYASKLGTVDYEKIDMLKPDYLLMNEPMYEQYFKGSDRIFKDYKVAFHYMTYPTRCYIFKRRDMQPPELIASADGKDGEISRDIFKRTVPGAMKMGEAYTVLVPVKNTGNSRTNFTVRVQPGEYTIFVDEKWWGKKITLNKGSTHIFKFKIVPIREYAGELPVTVDLYVRDEEKERYIKADSFSDYVYLIEK